MAVSKSKATVVKDKNLNSRLRKSIYLLPNMLTAANMVLGLLSIVFAVNDSLTLSMAASSVIPFVLSAYLIILAAFMDFTDGFVARATGTTSRFGMEFDSLSDLISFGVAPAILIISCRSYVIFLRWNWACRSPFFTWFVPLSVWPVLMFKHRLKKSRISWVCRVQLPLVCWPAMFCLLIGAAGTKKPSL